MENWKRFRPWLTETAPERESNKFLIKFKTEYYIVKACDEGETAQTEYIVTTSGVIDAKSFKV